MSSVTFDFYIDKENSIGVQGSVSRSPFPSCCGIDLYCNIHIQPLSTTDYTMLTTVSTAIENDPKLCKKFYTAVEEAMMKASKGRGLILVCDGLDVGTLAHKSTAIGRMSRFVEVMGWNSSVACPNPAHQPINTAVFCAWKPVYKVKEVVKKSAKAIVPTKNKLEELYGSPKTTINKLHIPPIQYAPLFTDKF